MRRDKLKNILNGLQKIEVSYYIMNQQKYKNVINSNVMARVIIKHKLTKPRRKRPGIHAKTKSSKLKNSKNYVKRYRKQGR